MEHSLIFTQELPQEGNEEDIVKFLVEHWGSTNLVSRGKVTNGTQIPRFVVRAVDGTLVGLLTYLIDREHQACEVVSINSAIECHGIATRLLELVEAEAKEKDCRRIWLITTNDNLEAAAFYVKRGFRLINVHIDALKKSRELKPQIPQVGKHGILLLDEWEFEKQI